ncbi:ADP-dependent (S)-NAD(P)H-hydrate dehydratase / NAD(P)H-hydrate epimerase [Candidatus Hydrogenisulfobacillus filiaventi]|uniref:Bifunctional NAD(P)H-hydrate repair enzyme n=1 Tax=Candidatus Hydrogenisulfobacillus filiaventi TaxID=2707344 RepID=A0A6F8ZHQ4_9FIRM|nr:NAD(P)H-hydrate dehydratase [Bacillota bacterium]CAB1129294.1 ADP-dependent (S)-NAD(P)H-hydrate dehydratase / NAD(P)H-hydrate epimerase [Candidatus Hydrogenisulfobacillus filiaventi]
MAEARELVLGVEEARQEDRLAAERGVPTAWLMESAGAAVAREAARLVPPGSVVTVLVGPGANGGDGLVAARHLASRFRVRVALARGVPALDHGPSLVEAARAYGAMVEDAPAPATVLAGADLVIDALLGTGARGTPRGQVAAYLEVLGCSGLPVLAVDLPSGVDADTGQDAGGLAPQAVATVTFGASKFGHWTFPGAGRRGRLVVADIGLPGADARWRLLGPDQARAWLPPVEADTHKGRRGRVVVVGGSATMPGAPSLAAEAALRAGAGLVELWVPEGIAGRLAVSPAVIVVPLPQTASGSLRLGPAERARLAQAGAVVFGPGLGRQAGAGTLQAVLAAGRPTVIDADGLNLLASLAAAGILPRLGPRVALTPHPGEMGRLLGRSAQAVEADRRGAVEEAERRLGAAVLLKGPFTLVAGGGGAGWVNTSGHPALATGGSGDVLSGIAGALLARGLEAVPALALAAYLHGWAGLFAAVRVGERAVIAPDLIAALGQAAEAVAGAQRPVHWPQWA